MTLAANALTTVAAVETYGGITASTPVDAKIEGLINAVSDRMERECGRIFAAQDLFEWYNITSTQLELMLKNYPLIRQPRIAFGYAQAATITYAGSAISVNLSVQTDRATITAYSTTGVRTQTDYLFSTYGSVSALMAAFNTFSGISATQVVNVPSFRINPLSGGDLLLTTQFLTYPDMALQNDSVQADVGAVQLKWPANLYGWSGYERPYPAPYFPSGSQYVLAEYRAGYETIPAALAMLCNELVTDVYNFSTKDRSITNESLGDYSYGLVNAYKFSEDFRLRLGYWMRTPVGAN